jgi:hypothetical protein
MVDELISAAWKARKAFLFDIEPLEASVSRARQLGVPGQLPVVMLDHYDNCAKRRHDGYHRYAAGDYPTGSG